MLLLATEKLIDGRIIATPNLESYGNKGKKTFDTIDVITDRGKLRVMESVRVWVSEKALKFGSIGINKPDIK